MGQNRMKIQGKFSVTRALKLAKKKWDTGSIEEAKSIYQEIISKYPKNKTAVEALRSLSGKNFTTVTPAKISIEKELGVVIKLYNDGQLKNALEKTEKLLKLSPYSITLLNLKGAIKIKQGNPAEALEIFTKIIKLNPKYPDGYNNMGMALQELSRTNEALNFYQSAVKIKPNFATAHNNIGNVLLELGQIAEAIKAYCNAISCKKDYSEAYFNLSLALRDMIFTRNDQSVQGLILDILENYQFSKPKDLVKSAISILKFNRIIIKLSDEVIDSSKTTHLKKVVLELSKVKLFCKFMTLVPLPDITLEKILTELRSAILKNIYNLDDCSYFLSFQRSLALQCFINEYIYLVSNEEAELIKSLEAEIGDILKNGDQPSAQMLLCLASYKPLNEVKFCDKIIVNEDTIEVHKQQIDDPRRENQLKKYLTSIATIKDKVSAAVRAQYEENPYPRWIKVGLHYRAVSIARFASETKLKLANPEIRKITSPTILIAGCGTGQHAITTASRFKNSQVIALDLSLASLGYAKRKTEEIGLNNIEYIHGDILHLQQLGKNFDIIESSGVLHHMNSPIDGWKALVDCLSENGLMKIGLYSELARDHIVKIRGEVEIRKIAPSPSSIKIFRNEIIKSSKEHHKRILNSSDFYSTSDLRDLLFHVKEHRFSIPQIKKYLNQLQLKFCGFEGNLVKNFKKIHNKKEDPYDLDRWQAYETANPRAFARMYQFWCQKAN